MKLTQSSLLLAVAVAGAGAYAFLHDTPPSEVPHTMAAPADEPLDDPGTEGTDPTEGQESMDPDPDQEPAAIEWSVPSTWRSMPNPSAMRLATYAVPHAGSDTVDADVSVSRAGGDVDSNIERWAGQFAGGAAPTRRSISVRGLAVILVEMSGTYEGGMGAGGGPHPGWALEAAIVQAPGQPYFFKMTGPAATVRAASGPFQAMIEGLRRPGEAVDAAAPGDARADAARR